MAVHELKCHPEPFQALVDVRKSHETRVEDERRFEVEDFLHLKEWHPKEEKFTGRTVWRKVTYLTRGPSWGLPLGMVVMSVRTLNGLERNDAIAGKLK